MNRLKQLKDELRQLADPQRVATSLRFFKTAKGQYGEGDVFLGISVPQLRKQVIKYRGLSLVQLRTLLKSKYHEERLLAVLLMVDAYKRGDGQHRTDIYQCYLDHTKYINNWDIVDSSAYFIVGPYLEKRSKAPLHALSRSDSLWERRIAVISTYHFIRNHQFGLTLQLSKRLLNDREDLIHKAVGWMLREVGNRDKQTETDFLNKHYKTMPRTMLRYAIEKYSPDERKAYLKGSV